MSDSPLSIIFLWHMHQPCYKDPFSGVYRLPWVRLHGTKDYLDMAKILEDFPAVHQTFNLVPSLLEQLRDYTDHGATDRYLQLTLRDPADLTEEERLFVLENFFLANWDNMIKPLPRYYELLRKRGFRFTRTDLARLSRYFTDQEIRDLQLLFNLTWIDPVFVETDPFLSGLREKGSGFTEEEKALLIEKQLEIMRGIIPQYKGMAASGQIELSVTPFYHPILPLLWDTDAARIAMPHVKLPKRRFSHPEDAVKQIRMGLDYFEDVFGYRPRGMWPSEGSVSEDVLRAIRDEGIRWVATDEEVLARSLQRPLRNPEGNLTDPQGLYRPYRFSDVSILFRDHKLSDLIGFVYSGWDAGKAVDDFMGRLVQIRDSLPKDRPWAVPVILDGENAWEYYRNDGRDFLRGLYEALSNDGRFRAVTVSEHLGLDGGEELPRLHAGSWINANFSIWLGHEEDNLAWDYLSQVREDLAVFQQENPESDLSEAWTAVYAAEGSDWNWWYGDEHATETQSDFDELFRRYLMQVYKVMGREIPPNLHIPILLEDRSVATTIEPRGFIHPTIDGLVTSYFEWMQGAYFDVKRSGGSMHKSESLITSLHYGFSTENLYVRVDPSLPFQEMSDGLTVRVNIIFPHTFRIDLDLAGGASRAVLNERTPEGWTELKEIQNVAALEIFEIEIPFADLRVKEGDEVHFSVEIMRHDEEAERCPWRGFISVTVPSPDYETMMWY